MRRKKAASFRVSPWHPFTTRQTSIILITYIWLWIEHLIQHLLGVGPGGRRIGPAERHGETGATRANQRGEGAILTSRRGLPATVWGGRIRTHKCRFQNWPLKCGPNFPSFWNA